MVELALLRAGIPLETLKQLSETDAWLYYFLLRKQDEITSEQATVEAMRMRNG